MSQDGNRIGYMLVGLLSDRAEQEALDGQCASDEFMAIHRDREARMFAFTSSNVEEAIQDLRSLAITFMGRLVCGFRHSDKAWFDAVLLFDLYCLRATTHVQAQDLPAICTALVMLLQKADDSMSVPRMDNLVTYGNNFRQFLNAQHNIDAPVLTANVVSEREMLVLEALRWQINMPTVDVWLSCICARINSLTRMSLLAMLVPVWQQSLLLARAIVLAHPFLPSLTPERLARGLLSLGCVAAKLLPRSSFGIRETDNLGEAFPMQPVFVAASEQEDARNEFLTEAMQLATRSTLATLQEDCELVRIALRDVDFTDPRLHMAV